MLPEPLHPAVVHLPIALALLVPLLAALAIVTIHAGFLPARSWLAIVFLQILLVGSSWLALETGEREEDRVERVVAERHIEAHEEAAEGLLALAGVGLLLCTLGLLPGRAGVPGRLAGLLMTAVVLAAGVRVGHSGGELVYEHGAAAAYTSGPGPGGRMPYDDEED